MLYYLGTQERATKYRGVEQMVARRAHNPEVAGSSPASATISSVLTAFERLLRTLAFLYSELTWGVVDNYAFSCIHRHLGCRKWEHIGNEDGSHTVVMDHKVLLPYPIDLLRLMDFDAIDQLIEHPGGQNLGSCVFADGGDKHIRRYGLAAELVHFSTEGLDLLGYLLLFIFVSAGHFCLLYTSPSPRDA